MAMRNVRTVIMLFLCSLQISCSENVFSNMSSKTTDEALLNDARTALNNQDYQGAINIILNDLSPEAQAKTEAKELLAGGYAGRCGLNFLSFIDSLSNASTGTAFALTAVPFVGVTVDPPSCLLALSTMESIAPAVSRTLSQNIFAAVSAMALMGTSTRLYTDNDPVGGDGGQDSSGISCQMTDEQVDHLVLGFGYMSENFSYLSDSQLGETEATFADIISICSSVGTFLGSTLGREMSCNVTDPSAITPELRDIFRNLLNTSEYGVGTVVTSGNPIAIVAACP